MDGFIPKIFSKKKMAIILLSIARRISIKIAEANNSTSKN